MSPVSIVWLKRDLRLQDHAPLAAAMASPYPTVLLYCFEPSLMKEPEYDSRHWRFVHQSLCDLNALLLPLKVSVSIVYCEVVQALNHLHTVYGMAGVFSHMETGLAITYARDRVVGQWLLANNIAWREYPAYGVQRARQNRKGWIMDWYAYMNAPLVPFSPESSSWFSPVWPDSFALPKYLEHHLLEKSALQQPGGPSAAARYLTSFIQRRHVQYHRHLSKPEESRQSCSRLSPYIAWGNLSLRQVYQSSLQTEASSNRPMQAFRSRLRWHCHFIQKFEMEHRMEFESLNKAYTDFQQEENEALYSAWERGRTGYPLVDACM